DVDAGVEEHVPAHLRPSAAGADDEDAEEAGPADAEASGADPSDEASADDEPEVEEDAGPVEDDVELPETVSASELVDSEAELGRVKAVLERLGPVNVLAAQEYEEQEERREFLHAQRRDVASSVESLKVTIAEINELSAQRFRETFDEVNRVFGETFIRLFRGGEAYMSLFDEEDLLETGIEITARPPGKRPQNISLLSGGEKALTAIALLFALFQTKPSPFCILDEVDAPLDDANVLRFVETLHEMAQDTQFLVVTHNKLTMEVAQSLYGVTMEEKGVSKLVQAQLDDLHPTARAANDRTGAQAVIPA
ncbi:MAG: AAA family ATPase, partial [Acidobacteriota bacterium]